MGWRKARWLPVLLLTAGLLLGASTLAEVSFSTGGSGEAEWEDVDTCTPDNWAVELSTFFDGDWSAVLLDCAERFALDEMTADPMIDYMHHPDPVQSPSYGLDCGPRVVLLLELAGITPHSYVAVSDAAPEQRRGCTTFVPSSWWYAEWDGVDFDSYGVEVAAGSLTNLQAALSGATVRAVGVLMGVVDTVGDLHTMGGDDVIFPGSAILDMLWIEWQWAGITYGGTYDLEPPWPVPFHFDDVVQPPDKSQWDEWEESSGNMGLWKRIYSLDLYEESEDVQDFPSDGYAAYFGAPVPNTGLGTYNTTGTRVRGELKSPTNNVNPGDVYITVEFDSYREVESYDGPFDQTYVQIKFDGQTWTDEIHLFWDGESPWDEDPWAVDNKTAGWKTIWYKDSRDAGDTDWAEVTVDVYPDKNGDSDPDFAIRIPNDATKVWIRFYFDSVDGYNNDYLGWLVDDIAKIHAPEPSENRILTDALPQGEVNASYSAQLEANQTVVRWELVSVEMDDPDGVRPIALPGLPERLALEHGSGLIWGVPQPGSAGTYSVTVKATFRSGRPVEVEKTLHLAIRAQSGTPNEIGSEDFGPPLFGANWSVDGSPLGPTSSCPNLWHEATASAVGVPDPAGQYGEVAYFGKDETGDLVDANYDCPRAKGCLVSNPYPIPADLAGEQITVGFKSWREVEFYDGTFDKTWVEARFEGGEWQTIWYKDSSNLSKKEWTWEEAETDLVVPGPPTRKIQLKFCFDSVDGYNNDPVGWLIDEVTIYAGSAELSIDTPCPMPETSVGQYYKEELRFSGGPQGRPEIEVIAGELPPGLMIWEDIPDSSWWILGIPREPGTFNFTLKLTIYDPQNQKLASVEKPCSIVVGGQVILLYEDFEEDPEWNWSELWHPTTDNGVKGVDDLGPYNHAAYYGQHDTFDPNYNTGTRTTGSLMLTSPEIGLTAATSVVGEDVDAVRVTFDFWREVEDFTNAYDYTKVQVSLDGGDWTSIWERNSTHPSQKEWISEEGIPAFLTEGADALLIRFVFDSVDSWYNHYTGWLVDNIRVEMADPGDAISLDSFGYGPLSARPRGTHEIRVMNVPNPVRDVHTTTFTVRAAGVEAMRIEIYDLDQSLVFEEEVPGNELEYHTVDKYGDYLANGVYFYRALVKIDKVWVTTKFEKLVILR